MLSGASLFPLLNSSLTLEGKLVGKARVNALVGSYLQDLEPLPTSRYLQDELVGNDCHL